MQKESWTQTFWPPVSSTHSAGVPFTYPYQILFRCKECEDSFPTVRGLKNHEMWHRDQEARSRNIADLPRPQIRQRRLQDEGPPAVSRAVPATEQADDDTVPAARIEGLRTAAVLEDCDGWAEQSARSFGAGSVDKPSQCPNARHGWIGCGHNSSDKTGGRPSPDSICHAVS